MKNASPGYESLHSFVGGETVYPLPL